jgi:hypothetical protein
MSKPSFISADKLQERIDDYFISIEEEHQTEEKSKTKKTVKTAEPATITGFAFFLGFNSRQEFDEYEEKGKFANTLKRGRLRIEAEYEKRLHKQSPQAAMFALKNMGWRDKAESKTLAKSRPKSIKIKVIETGPRPAGSEKEVDLS